MKSSTTPWEPFTSFLGFMLMLAKNPFRTIHKHPFVLSVPNFIRKKQKTWQLWICVPRSAEIGSPLQILHFKKQYKHYRNLVTGAVQDVVRVSGGLSFVQCIVHSAAGYFETTATMFDLHSRRTRQIKPVHLKREVLTLTFNLKCISCFPYL